jgi:glycosyltransferase involved in cell wall biosynthesis
MRLLIILDSIKYKSQEKSLKEMITPWNDSKFYYTDYENKIVKFFHRIPKIGNLFSHLAYWTISFFAAFHLILFDRKKYSKKIFINPIVGFFYCLLLSTFNQKDDVYLSGFLFVPKSNKFYFRIRKNLVLFSLKNVSKIIVYSKQEVDLYSDWFPPLALKFIFIKYGRDYDIFEEKQYETESEYIASGGVSNRDFNILANALLILEKKHLQLKCKIATRPDTFSIDCKPSCLEFLYNIRIDKFGSFLNNSLFVVIPLRNTSLSAGHMALFESMYRGKITLITDIPAVRDYVDGESVFFYKPDDPQDLANKIEFLYQNINTPFFVNMSQHVRQKYQLSFSFSSFLDRIVKEVMRIK